MDYEKTLLNAPIEEAESLAAMLGMENDYVKVLARVRSQVESGDFTYALWAGIMCLQGKLVEKDVAEALYFLSKAKEDKAPYHIGVFYKEEGDFQRAEYWLQKAREKDVLSAYVSSIHMEMRKEEDRNLSMIKTYLEKGIQLFQEKKEILQEDQKLEQLHLEAFLRFAKSLGANCIKKRQNDEAIEFLEIARILRADDEEVLDFLNLAYQSKGANYMISDPVKAVGLFQKALSFGSKKHEDLALLNLCKTYAYLVKKKDIPEDLEKEAVKYVEGLAEELHEPYLTSIYYYYYERRKKYREKFLNWAEVRALKGDVDACLSLSYAWLGEEHDKEMKGYKADLPKSKEYLLMAKQELDKKRSSSDYDRLFKRYNAIQASVKKEDHKTEKHFTHFDAKEVLQEMKAARSNVFRIPDGYTHIESRLLIDVKDAELIQEIVMTNSVRVIKEWAFGYIPNLKKITLSEELESLGTFAFNTELCYKGLKKLRRKKPHLERLFIAGTAQLEKFCFGQIEEIGELIFGEGRQELDIEKLDGVKVKYMYLPDSLKKYYNSYVGCRTNIEKISAPSSLKDVIRKQMNYDIKVENVVYRWSKG